MQTFLFTDIEGSTRLWSRAPIAMATAVQRQETLLRAAIERHAGAVFKTVGDGIYAVFPQAADGVEAAVAAQRALLAEPWQGFEPVAEIAVRIVIHSGPAEARDGDYFGPTLNRLSRTLAAGHGGQILCTDDTLAACGEDWPTGIDLRDLGERTLRDVPGSGRIFQLIAPGLPEHFPPLSTLDPRVHNLPRWPTALIGREDETARLRAELRGPIARLVTLLGTGGVGKTRLACAVAGQLLDEFQDGIRFIDLSALREGAQVVPAIVQVTGAADQLLTPHDALIDWLHNRSLLLVLDNCEQVVDGVAAIASDILNAAPDVVMLATSRTPIHIRGERQLTLDPLPTEVGVENSPAMLLFTERAQEVSERFVLDPDSIPEVAEICRLVDGLPLAIELAAAWVRVLSPAALHRRLQDNRAMLRDGARDLPDRQRALSATIAWSYDLLEPDDQRAFRRLAVFRGGIAVDAAAAVIWDTPVEDPLWALTRLDALVRANLLQVASDSTGEPRFVMLQTIQEIASDILKSSEEWDEAASAHASYFALLAADADRAFRTQDVGIWHDRLDREFGNLRSAIEYFAALPHASEQGLQMAVSLWRFLDQRGHEAEARMWLSSVFRDSADVPATLRAKALVHLGHSWLSNYEQAEEFYQRSYRVASEAGDDILADGARVSLGLVLILRGDYDAAFANVRQHVSFARAQGDLARLAEALVYLAHCFSEASQPNEAIAEADEAVSLMNDVGDPGGVAWAELVRGRALRRANRPQAALHSLSNARDGFVSLESHVAESNCLLEIASVLMRADLASARADIARANEILVENADIFAVVLALDVNAELFFEQGSCEIAAQLLGASGHWRATTGTTLCAIDRQARKDLVERIRLTLGDSMFEQASLGGQALSLRAALERAHLASAPVART